MRFHRYAVIVAVTTGAGVPMLGAQERVQLAASGGVLTSLVPFDRDGFREFKTGPGFGASASFWLDENLGLRLDGSYATSKVECALVPNPSGQLVDACAPGESGASWTKIFIGGDLLLRASSGSALRPFGFLGLGFARLAESGDRIAPANRPHGRFGVGLGYAPPEKALGLFLESALFVYDFDQTRYPFYNRVLVDAAFRAGISYGIR